MKKNLRLLCLGLAAATITCGFAQEDKTSLLKNTDMEQGLKGWSFDGGKLMGKNTKNPASRTGFYGMNEGVLEAWNGNGNGLGTCGGIGAGGNIQTQQGTNHDHQGQRNDNQFLVLHKKSSKKSNKAAAPPGTPQPFFCDNAHLHNHAEVGETSS